MADLKAPLLDAKGNATKDVTLEAAIFGAEPSPSRKFFFTSGRLMR